VVCRVLFASLPDRVPPLRLAAAALGASAIGLVIIAVVPAAWGLFLGAMVVAVGTAFLAPAVFAAIFGHVPAAQRGSAAGTASIFIDLGLSGGPVLLGLVVAASGIPAAFLAGAALTAGGLALLASRPMPDAPLATDPGTA
jgi:MFS family permease